MTAVPKNRPKSVFYSGYKCRRSFLSIYCTQNGDQIIVPIRQRLDNLKKNYLSTLRQPIGSRSAFKHWLLMFEHADV